MQQMQLILVSILYKAINLLLYYTTERSDFMLQNTMSKEDKINWLEFWQFASKVWLEEQTEEYINIKYEEEFLRMASGS